MRKNLFKVLVFSAFCLFMVQPLVGQETEIDPENQPKPPVTEVIEAAPAETEVTAESEPVETDAIEEEEVLLDPASPLLDTDVTSSDLTGDVEEDQFQAIDTTSDLGDGELLGELEEISFSRKLGGGLSLFSYFMGLQAFYEFKINPELLNTVRGQFVYDFLSVSSEGTNLGINRMFFGGTYRIPLLALKNAYTGIGGGYSQMSLNYENTNTGQSYSANGGGLYVAGELGWDKYWAWQEGMQMVLSVGMNVGFYLAYNSNYDETRISNKTNHRDVVNEGWTAAQQIVHLTVGLGSTF